MWSGLSGSRLPIRTIVSRSCIQPVQLIFRGRISQFGYTMASRARVDERGRLQIPQAERESASIPTNSEVLVVPKSPGHLELILVGEARLERFQKKIRGRLKAWKEEEHRADGALRELSRKSRVRT